jgi:NAD(P)-dependent dehydrogenase (short-subunit alcohol dehydrogenase family)
VAHQTLVRYNAGMQDLTGRVAAVTGAASGIGRALALRLVDEGCHLALSDVDAEGLAETARRCADRGGVEVSTTVVDVADHAAVEAWAAAVVDRHGRVDLVVNNAGVAMAGTVADTPLEDYRWLMGIDFWGVVHGTKAFLPHLLARGEGHVVNVSSIFGLFAQPSQSGYNAAKFAVRGFTESLRQELDLDGGRVSATSVHPGGIATAIARNARVRPSTGEVVGGDAEAARRGFERLLRTSADEAAVAILDGVRRDARRVLIGGDARAVDLLQRVAPTGYQRVMGLLARASRVRARRRSVVEGGRPAGERR